MASWWVSGWLALQATWQAGRQAPGKRTGIDIATSFRVQLVYRLFKLMYCGPNCEACLSLSLTCPL